MYLSYAAPPNAAPTRTNLIRVVSQAASKIIDWVNPNDKSGEFKRQTSSFRSRISREPGAPYPPERGRYHLYVSYACPWAHRTLITRKLKALEDVISFSVVHPHLADGGWRFPTDDEADPATNLVPDSLAHRGGRPFTRLMELYRESDPEYADRATVPVLYDKKTQTIVSNESAEIIRMLNSEFNDLIEDQDARSLDLYPDSGPVRDRIDEVNGWMYDGLNNGVYKAGFATTQEAYDAAVQRVFESLDRIEHMLADETAGPRAGPNFHLLGTSRPTEADVRMYVTVSRFDPVYVQHFKCNIRDVRSGYPHLHRWLRRLYWECPAFGPATTRWDHIKLHYTKSQIQINPKGITAAGPVPNILPLDEEVRAVGASRQ